MLLFSSHLRFSVENELPGLDLSSPALRDMLDNVPAKDPSGGKDKEVSSEGQAVGAWNDAAAYDWDADGG